MFLLKQGKPLWFLFIFVYLKDEAQGFRFLERLLEWVPFSTHKEELSGET